MKSIYKKAIIVSIAAVVIVSIPIALFLSLPPAGFSVPINPVNPAHLGVAEWLEDFQYLYNYIERNYPFLWVKERTHGINWTSLKSMFEDQISNAQNNAEFLSIIFSAVLALQNRHTWVMNPTDVIMSTNNYADSYPLNLVFTEQVADAAAYWQSLYSTYMADKYNWEFDTQIVYDRGNYVLHDFSLGLRNLYGDYISVIEVDGVPIDEAIETCYDKDFINQDFNRNKNYLWAIHPYCFGSDAVFTIRNATGYEADLTFAVVPGYAGIPFDYPSIPIQFNTYPSDSIGYMYAGTFGEGVDMYYDDVINFYSQIENYDYLILDIRGNTGGFYSKWINGIVSPLTQTEIVHIQHFAYRTDDYVYNMQSHQLDTLVPKTQFSYLPPEVLTDEFEIRQNMMTYSPLGQFNFTGEIALLTDSVVYSAAEGFANFCREFNFAEIYGTETGGDGIILFPLYFVLPNSKLVISSASSIGLDGTGNANEEVKTQPDVYYESAFGNWTELIDFVIADLLGS
jgi:hypothetical protein